MYVNDIPINNGTHVSQYADDLGLYAINKNLNYVRLKLQQQLQALEQWCNNWYIKLKKLK